MAIKITPMQFVSIVLLMVLATVGSATPYLIHQSTNPPLSLSFSEGYLSVLVLLDPDLQLPPIRLGRVNRDLLEQHPNDYLLVRDLNGDGITEIAVLKSTGYGEGNRCYRVFQYQPGFYSFSPRPVKTVCLP